VKLVDANVLLYAVNESDPHHDDAHTWLDQALTGQETVGFAWAVLLAFVRLGTRPGLFPAPLSVVDALAQVRDWTAAAPSVVLHPTPRHLTVLTGLLGAAGTGGNLVSDAHLAALSLEHGAQIVTYDNDFDRFPDVTWMRPAS
jgi:toxin-antitoxin system PIN domain toxin